MARGQRLSRPKRWARAVAEALDLIREIEEKEALTFSEAQTGEATENAAEVARLREELEGGPLNDLEALREEYEDWQSGLPENLQTGTLAERLEAVVALEFTSWSAADGEMDEIRDVVEEAENVDLPLGFGRD